MLGVRGASKEVPLESDDRHDRHEEGELELHEQREHGAERGGLGPPASEEIDRPDQEEGADRVHLAPDRRVKDDTGVEEVEGRRGDAQRLRGHPQVRARAELGSPAPRDGEEEPRDPDVGEDARDLHQAARRVLPDDRRQHRPDGAEQPQDVEIARRVVAEVAVFVEVGWSEAC
jgi:hypothetical protein